MTKAQEIMDILRKEAQEIVLDKSISADKKATFINLMIAQRLLIRLDEIDKQIREK